MSKASDEFQHPPRSKKDFTEDGEGSTKKRETKRRRVTEKASDGKVHASDVIIIDAILTALYDRRNLEKMYAKNKKDPRLSHESVVRRFGSVGVKDLENEGWRYPTKISDIVSPMVGRKKLDSSMLERAVKMIDIEEHPEDGYIKIEKVKDVIYSASKNVQTQRIRLTKMGLMHMHQRSQSSNTESPSSLFWEIVGRSSTS